MGWDQNKTIFKLHRTKALQNSSEILKKSNCLVTVKFKKKFKQSLHLFPVLQKLTHMKATD